MANKNNKNFFMGFLKDDLFPLLGKYLKTKIDQEIRGIEKTVNKRVSYHIKKMYLSITIFTGAVFLMVGFGFLVEEIVSFPKGSGFILVGAIILLSSFIIKSLMYK